MKSTILNSVIATFVLSTPLVAIDRTAFIIGNDAYPDNPLANAVRDSRALKSMLIEDLSFTEEGIVYVENANRIELFEKFEVFKKLSADAGIVFLYYAGHGMESIDGKENFLLPIDVPVGEVIRSEAVLRASGVNLMTLCTELAESTRGAKVVLMDCCRESPTDRGMNRAGGGLVTYPDADIPADTLMILAAAPNRVASDGNQHGPFTEAILEVLPRNRGNLMDAFFAVSDRVQEKTRQAQIPWLKFDGSGQIFRGQSLLGNGAKAAIAGGSPQESAETDELRERLGRLEAEREAKSKALTETERKSAMPGELFIPRTGSTPEGTVMRYYEAINSRDIDYAYSLRSQYLNRSYSLQEFRSTFSGTRKADLTKAEEVANDGSAASVGISVDVLDGDGAWSTWSGNVHLENEDGVWKISRMKDLMQSRRAYRVK